ncbi:MAG: photoactive yellow protein [Pseudomonadota bacterium]
MEIIPFGSNDVDNILQKEPQRAENLAFGAVLLDRTGKIIKYNQAEGLISGRSVDDVIGKNFFNDIAPCAKGKKFHGLFLQFSQTGSVNTMLDYEFDYKMSPVKVRIHMKSAPSGDQCWLFVKRV